MKCIFLPIIDYLCTRKKLWFNYLLSAVPATIALIVSLIINVNDGVDISELFSSFVNTQITVSAILISFSIAIITILVTSDNKNIRELKETKASNKNYKPLKDGSRLTLFQVLLSNVTYNVLVQILYLATLIAEIFAKTVLQVSVYKYLASINIFLITHILYVLIESVVNMYLVFWKDCSR